MAIDFKRGAKVTGSKFYFLTGADAQRELDLINLMVTYHQKNGYEFVIPPYMVNEQTATYAGVLPRFKGDYYETNVDGRTFLMIPTAETPLVGMHADEILTEDELPIKYVALSPCFRKECGTYGKRDKGLRRVHQFHKVELFVICKPEDSERLHQEMQIQVVNLLSQIRTERNAEFEIRTLELAAYDRAPWSDRTIDVEIQLGDEWLEISSISNTGTNQSIPAKIRYKPKQGGKNKPVHLLNGSGVALPRLTLVLQEKEKVMWGWPAIQSVT